MKKTYANNKDRVIFAAYENALYYQPERSSQRYYLTKSTRGINSYFHDYGRRDCAGCYSMSVGQLYNAGRKRHHPLNQLMDYLPSYINYVIRQEIRGETEDRPVRCLLDDLLPDIA